MLKSHININDRRIAVDQPPYIVAELSANHNGNLETAFRLIEEAKIAGADAVKLQTYRPDTITLDSNLPEFQIDSGPWKGRTLYELYEWAHTPWEWHQPLFERARKIGITIFSSPFDFSAVDLLEDLNAPVYKIASFEVVDLPLIEYAARTGKPLIISTGMANDEEIMEAIDTARSAGSQDLAILHCVSGYPAPADDYNLRTIPDMINRFGLVTGLSDHTLGNATAVASVALGASIIEKHFTLDRKGGGPDDSFSLELEELSVLCRDCREAWNALGKVNYKMKSSEVNNSKLRRSLYFVRNIKQGEKITEGDIKSVRPGYGLPPKYVNQILGKRAARDIQANTPVSYESICE